jgi:hypothetical protein
MKKAEVELQTFRFSRNSSLQRRGGAEAGGFAISTPEEPGKRQTVDSFIGTVK